MMFDLKENGLKLYKFEYIRDVIIKGIANGDLKAHTKLPSINHICQRYNLSQVTVRRAYMHLRKRGYIAQLPGLGYFVENTAGIGGMTAPPVSDSRQPVNAKI
jgi:DNA-binding GntR family transcriptional regulator